MLSKKIFPVFRNWIKVFCPYFAMLNITTFIKIYIALFQALFDTLDFLRIWNWIGGAKSFLQIVNNAHPVFLGGLKMNSLYCYTSHKTIIVTAHGKNERIPFSGENEEEDTEELISNCEMYTTKAYPPYIYSYNRIYTHIHTNR